LYKPFDWPSKINEEQAGAILESYE
jgi:hypothetical protein